MLAAEDDATPRVWKDKRGQYRLEATFQSATLEKVTLKRADDGRVVTVPLATLSESDLDFLRKHSPEIFASTKRIATAASLETAAKRRRLAIDSLAMYDRFLADVHVPAAEKTQASKLREQWLALARANKVRVGKRWYTPAEFDDLVKDELAILDKAREFTFVSDVETVTKKLKDASELNPASIRADFQLGLLNALTAMSPKDAEKCFADCVSRLGDYDHDLTDAERANLAGCYNNLALTCIRQRKWAEALRHWEKCLSAAPASEAVLHNLGYLQTLARQQNSISFPKAEDQRLDRLSSAVSGIAKAYDPKRGWRYMPLGKTRPESDIDAATVSKIPTSAAAPTGDLVLLGGGTGFVISKGLVVTNSHVVENGLAFYLRKDGEDKAIAKAAQLVHISRDARLDLALLKCDDLTSSILAINPNPLKLSAEIRALGFPLFSTLGSNIKVTSGIITALPPHRGLFAPSLEDYVMHDAIINKGCSGGPLCDRNGLVVGVNTARHPDYEYGFAVTPSELIRFLQPLVPDLEPKPPVEAELKSWEEAVEKVRASTVQVFVYTKPDRYNPVLQTSVKGDRSAYDDNACMTCNGMESIQCPVRGCSRGKVNSVQQFSKTTPRGNVINWVEPTAMGAAQFSAAIATMALTSGFASEARLHPCRRVSNQTAAQLKDRTNCNWREI